jgi:hypothetical protein
LTAVIPGTLALSVAAPKEGTGQAMLARQARAYATGWNKRFRVARLCHPWVPEATADSSCTTRVMLKKNRRKHGENMAI